jgi:hypothetical protein
VKAAMLRYCMEFVRTIIFFFLLSSHPSIQLPVWLDDVQEASSLCRVFRDHEQSKTHQMLQKLACTDTARETNICPRQLNVPDADIGQSSTSRPQVCQPQLRGIHTWLGLDFAALFPHRKISIFLSSFDTSSREAAFEQDLI